MKIFLTLLLSHAVLFVGGVVTSYIHREWISKKVIAFMGLLK